MQLGAHFALTGQRSHVLLAPSGAPIPPTFGALRVSAGKHSDLLSAMQRLRGRIALREGAITGDQLDNEGRHRSAIDERSWHLLSIDGSGDVVGCVRLLLHEPNARFEDLTVSHAALAQTPDWATRLRRSVEAEMRRARMFNIAFLEVGGWVLADQVRYSTEAVKVALGVFAFGRLLGGAVALATATARNHSSLILSRLGGRPLQVQGEDAPEYYEPQYRCTMSILRFDAFACASKYDSTVSDLVGQLASAPVYCAEQPYPAVTPTLPATPVHVMARAAMA